MNVELPETIRRRRARERLEDAIHQVNTRGPEGNAVYYDEKGKRSKGGGKVDHVAFREYIDRLRCISLGDTEEEAEILVEQKRVDRSLGKVEALLGGGKRRTN